MPWAFVPLPPALQVVGAEEDEFIPVAKVFAQLVLHEIREFLESENIKIVVTYALHASGTAEFPTVRGVLVKLLHPDVVGAYTDIDVFRGRDKGRRKGNHGGKCAEKNFFIHDFHYYYGR